MKFQKGDLVIAKVELKDDENFRNGIFLFVDVNEKEALAFILNKPLGLVVGEIVSEFACQNTTFYGGPISTDTVYYIHKFGGVHECVEIIDGIFWGGNFEEIKLLSKHNKFNENNSKFFVGYTRWNLEELKNDSRNFRKIGQIRSEEIFISNKESVESWERLYIQDIESGFDDIKPSSKHLRTKKECKVLIAKNELKKAIQLVIDVQGFDDSSSLNEIIMLSSNLHEIETKKRIGILDNNEEIMMMNKLRDSLLKLIDKE